MNLQKARTNMIEQQVRPWDVLDQRVLDVLDEVPRERFVAEQYRQLAYSDYALPIGEGQKMFKPTLDGRLLQALLLDLTDTVLEIGAGSGYLTACLARLSSRVDALEINATLAESARLKLDALGVSNVNLLNLDATETWDARDGYDAIVFGGAIPAIPSYYQGKLKPGGRLVAIIGDETSPAMEAVSLTRVDEDEWFRESLFDTQVPQLSHFSDSTDADHAFIF